MTALDVPAKDLSLRGKNGKRTSTQEAPMSARLSFVDLAFAAVKPARLPLDLSTQE